MITNETVNKLRLNPEIDPVKGTEMKFTNSDKFAAETNLGTNPATLGAAFHAAEVAMNSAVITFPESE